VSVLEQQERNGATLPMLGSNVTKTLNSLILGDGCGDRLLFRIFAEPGNRSPRSRRLGPFMAVRIWAVAVSLAER
jgi:hypothetical protein